jgi:cytochrome c oxidase subunit 2
LHTPASEHGSDVDNLMNITWVLIFIVQAITQVLLHYFAFKYRGKQGQKSIYFDNKVRGNLSLILPLFWLG